MAIVLPLIRFLNNYLSQISFSISVEKEFMTKVYNYFAVFNLSRNHSCNFTKLFETLGSNCSQ